MRLRRAARVILIGAPGVGKGTQSKRLLTRFPQLSAISSGDLLRYNVKNRTPLGIKVENTMKTGGLVSDDLILRLITNELGHRGWLYGGRPNFMTLSSSSEAASLDGADAFGSTLEVDPLAGASLSPQASEDPAASFLLDGFPRTAAQAQRLDDIVPINWVVSLQTPFDVIMERISSRWVHEPSGRIYNTTFNAPKVPGFDDVTGERLVQRADDSEEVYRARFQKFQETSEPLLDHYAKKGVLWEVHGMSSDEISPKLYQEFENRFL
ncbi:adenylate kinase [Daldinia bambusicola]|nr:adenylate kinase [Daldinia bambusicola]